MTLVQSLHIFLILFQKCSVTFYCNWIAKTETRFLSTVGPETEEKIELAKNEIRFDL